MSIKEANQGGCKDLLNDMSQFEWMRTHEKVANVKNIEDTNKLENHNVLPEEVKVKEAFAWSMYIGATMDARWFHRPKEEHFPINNNYDTRKAICDKLHKIYRNQDFDWCNQSFKAMASAPYRQQAGYLPD